MLIFWAVLGGFLLDAVFGDPVWLLHPVVLMGRCITALEKRLRAALPKTPQGELAGGCIVAAVLPLGTLAVTGLSCWVQQKSIRCWGWRCKCSGAPRRWRRVILCGRA